MILTALENLPVTSKQSVLLPLGSSVIAVELQRGKLTLFATVSDPNATPVSKTVYMVGAGDTVPIAQYVGNDQDGSRGWFVFVE